MDDMEPFFDGKNIIHRAITSPLWHHIFYNLIILFELLAGILCVIGAIIMFINVKKNDTHEQNCLYGAIDLFP